MWGALSGQIISYLISMCPGTRTSWNLLCSTSFTRDWWQPQTNLKFIWLSERKYMFLPVYPFSIYSITQALMAHISAWNNAVWSPRLKAVSPSQAPSIHPSTSEFIGLPSTFIRELDHECLVVYSSCPIYHDFFMWLKSVDLGLYCWVTLVCWSPPGLPPQSSHE